MVQIGTIEYEAKVTGVAEAKANAQDFADSQNEVAESSERAAASGGLLAGTFGFLASSEEEAGEEADRTNTKVDVLTSGLTFLTGTVASTAAQFLGLSGVMGTVTGALGTAKAALSGLTLSGIMGSVSSSISGFVSWLAAGSAGAIAFAAAIGAAIGVVGVWILEVTGALDAVRGFGQFVAGALPGWVRDGLLMVLSIFTGVLAGIGAFIVGTIQGGFDEGFARAEEVLNIFIGAWERNISRFVSGVTNLKNQAVQGFNNLKNSAIRSVDQMGNRFWSFARDVSNIPGNLAQDFFEGMGTLEGYAVDAADFVVGEFESMGSAVAGSFGDAWNSVVPASLDVPSVTIGGGSIAGQDIPETTIGGGSINLPQLQTGGMVDETGLAVVHEGESVIPEPLTSAARSSDGGGGDVTVENVTIRMSGEFNPSDMSRRELEDLADSVAKAIGKKTNTTAGVR